MKYFICLFIWLSFSSVRAQTTDSLFSSESNIPTAQSRLSFYGGFGALEIVALGVQYSVNDHGIVGLKYSSYITSGKGFILPITGVGPGITYSYHTDEERFFNTTNLELTYMFDVAHCANPKYGIGMEITTGYKSYRPGLHLYLLVGVSGSFVDKIPDLILPSLKLGTNYNF